MARSTFGGYGGDQVAQDPALNSGFYKSASSLSATGTFWSAQTGGTQYTDLIDPVTTVALTGISTDTKGHLVPFQGPNGVNESGWVDFGAGRFKVMANDYITGLDARYDAKYPTKGSLGVLASDYGVRFDGVAQSPGNLNTAIAAAIAANAPLILSPGTVTLTPSTNAIMCPLTQGVRIVGAGRGQTTIKVAAGAVNWKGFIGSNTTGVDLTGLELSGFTFDYNTANNPLTDTATLSSGNRAAVMAMRGAKIRVHDIDAINGDGVWVVQLGGTYAAAIQSGDRCDDASVDVNVLGFGVSNLYHDSSAVYIIGDRAKVRGTYTAVAAAASAICAVEVHGDDYDVSATTYGWVKVANLTGLDSKTNHGGTVHDCLARACMVGPSFWCGNDDGATGVGIDGLLIHDNDIEIDPDYWSGTGKPSPPANFQHSGINLMDISTTENLPMRNIKINDNQIRYKTASTSAQKVLDAGISLQRAGTMTGSPANDYNIDISDNTIDSPLSAGVVVDLKNKAVGLKVNNNHTRNPAAMGVGTVGTQYASGVVLIGDFRNLQARNNTVDDDRGTTVANSVVDASGVSLSSAAARVSITDPLLTTSTGTFVVPVVGPASGPGVYLRMANYGWGTPSGQFSYGSEVIDYNNGHMYRQTTSASGTSWQLWLEVRPEGLALGAASVVVATPTGLPYIATLAAAGPPTGAPTTRTGMTPLVMDTNGKLWAYVGGAWKGVLLT